MWTDSPILTHDNNIFGPHKVVGLEAHPDNRSSTVMETFIHAVEKYGLPSHVHGDHGGENKEVSVFMIMTRGPNHGSFMWGT